MLQLGDMRTKRGMHTAATSSRSISSTVRLLLAISPCSHEYEILSMLACSVDGDGIQD